MTKPVISRSNILILSGILASLFLVGSFYDLRVSENLLDKQSSFGIFFAAFGAWPMVLALTTAGTLLIVFRDQERRRVGVLQAAGGIAILSAATIAGLVMPTLYFDLNQYVIYLISTILTVAGVWGAVLLSKGANRRMAIRVAVLLFVVVAAEILIVNILKIGWERPRMRMLVEQPAVVFEPWWNFGNDSKEQLLAAGVESDDFKSFPSGHAANAAVLMLLSVLGSLRKGLAKYVGVLFWVGAFWTGVVVLSRIIVGAHFITDIVAGVTVTFAVILVAYRMVFKDDPHKTVSVRESVSVKT